MSASVVTENRSGVLWVRIDRPDALNALDENVLDGLGDALALVEQDESIGAMVLTGTGRAFSVGLDIDCLERGFGDHAYFRHLLGRVNAVLHRIEAAPVPVICAVNGLTRAGGFELLLASDIAFAAEEAQIGDVHLSFSVMPGGGSTQRLPRRIGTMRAKELIFSARWMDGAEAARIGVVHRAVPVADLEEVTEEYARGLTHNSRPCLAATKRAINEGATLPVAEGVALETRLFFEYLETYPDATERVGAYLASRKSRQGS